RERQHADDGPGALGEQVVRAMAEAALDYLAPTQAMEKGRLRSALNERFPARGVRPREAAHLDRHHGLASFLERFLYARDVRDGRMQQRIGVTGGRLRAVVDADLPEDALHVVLYRERADRKRPGDLEVGAAAAHCFQYLHLAGAELQHARMARAETRLAQGKCRHFAERVVDLHEQRVE